MISIATLILAFLPPYQATVVAVHDGDTITVRSTETVKIRLYGVDAPELKQPHGQASKQALSGLVYGKTIEVIPKNKDRYGRTVAQIKADGVDVNNKMVALGAAWWYTDYAKHDTIKQMLQTEAQGKRAGLWAEEHPMPPWEFRKRKKAPIGK